LHQESGFVFSLRKDELEGDLPRGFVNRTSQKGKWLFSSMELVSDVVVVSVGYPMWRLL
jgi:DNA mismatch repair protein MSH4